MNPAGVVLRPCQSCGEARPTRLVTFRRSVGMLYKRRNYTTKGNLCRTCIHKYFWSFQGKNLLFGPWAAMSLLLTPIYLVGNIFSYAGALFKLPRRS